MSRAWLTDGATWRAVIVRAVAFSIAWWAIVEGRPVGWYFAVSAVVFATGVSMLLNPPGRWSLTGLVRFVPFFLFESVRGGLDVAMRAFRPGTHIAPGFVEHRFRSDDPYVHLLTANVVSLTPGTLGARIEGDVLMVHLLDVDSIAQEMPERVERHMRAMRPPG